ncbi:dipeptide/oligopeptide/nickel ABC transporter permease/ATP-binding protein [Actinoplanes bogorensis]|uniref:Dipeptide/oligopeptide/nickel ABC transporter permease/ATP-binding protein n=1 Tax=Paractinoplanes bogorensis TaxID=1610840 RepID=A0ABS5YKZ5_9ACTN|nr:dipeptide/oligopeptide/nickel ABC transporter permease/ATP-binding protein [Actinoplanes bogorensis]MBU2664102.1 dipeptide/oligopeptide/nickel ABC transporter permease/ATP-binding protein [Actinoplanes bogorensis]
MILLRRLLRQPLAIACLAVITLVVLACVFASLVAPYDPYAQDLANILSGPSGTHWLGTDALGRDVLSRILYGGRVTLFGTLQAVVTYVVIGVSIGLIAGTIGGIVDSILMRVADVIQSIPALITLLVVLAVFGRSETAAMVSFGIFASAGLMRVVRGVSMIARTEPYVAAGTVAGLGPFQILWRHIRPAVIGPVLTQVSLFAGIAMLVEASLGFLNLGVLPPAASWGNLVSDAQLAINRQQWLLVPTGGIVALMCLCLTLLGIALRDTYSSKSTAGGKSLSSWRSFAATMRRVPATPAAAAPALVSEYSQTAGREILLEVQDLSVAVGDLTLVDGVSFDVGRGETIGIVGESGCGKSMTVSGLLRVPPPGATISAARLTLGGEDLLGLSEQQMHKVRGKRIAYISQEPISSLDPLHVAGRQVAEAVRAHRGVSRSEARRIALELLASVRLPDPEAVYTKYPHEMSGGMAQRVAIARALAGEPELLIADEPTTALDVSVQAGVLDLLVDLRDQRGMSLILVTHDWGVLADVCDRAIVMYAGQIVEDAPTADLIAAPRHPYSAALLESIPAKVAPGVLLPMIGGTVPAPADWPSSCRFAGRCRFATDDCTHAPIPLTPTVTGVSRCVHVDRLEEKEAADAVTTA